MNAFIKGVPAIGREKYVIESVLKAVKRIESLYEKELLLNEL